MGGSDQEGSGSIFTACVMNRICILSPVWPSYTWLASALEKMLDEFWEDHPPLYFCGPSRNPECKEWLAGNFDEFKGKNWTWNLREGVRAARAMGYEEVYLINEEHVPVASCNSQYLNVDLPNQANNLNACYVSLFGWDNKRFCSKSSCLKESDGAWMHLVGKKDPRFHLHPAWWRVDALEACCDLVLADGGRNGSAWHFEKTCDDWDVERLQAMRLGCFQISAGHSGEPALTRNEMCLRLLHRWICNKAMAIFPLLPSSLLRNVWCRMWEFDNVVSHGAYPMAFSGVLAKGRINSAFIRACNGSAEGKLWLSKIYAMWEKQLKCRMP